MQQADRYIRLVHASQSCCQCICERKIREEYYICVCLKQNAGHLRMMQPKPPRAVRAFMLHFPSKERVQTMNIHGTLLMLDIPFTFIRKLPNVTWKCETALLWTLGKGPRLVMFAWQQVASAISEQNLLTNPRAQTSQIQRWHLSSQSALTTCS